MTTSASTSPDRSSTCGFAGGPPGIRTPNLRIKSLVKECWSESCTASELVVCVSTHPVVSQRFPFHHGDETGTGTPSALSFPGDGTSSRGVEAVRSVTEAFGSIKTPSTTFTHSADVGPDRSRQASPRRRDPIRRPILGRRFGPHLAHSRPFGHSSLVG